MDGDKLEGLAKRLMGSEKGILASDESYTTLAKKLETVGIDDTADNRRRHHELYFTTPDIEKYLSGVILFAEAYIQATDEGESLIEVLEEKGILQGIKVDKGKVPLPNGPGETLTQGLDGLPDRLAKYAGRGATFTKWRSVFQVTDELPSEAAVLANAEGMALYAAMAQEAGLVPIVEPEVLITGEHTQARCEEVIGQVLPILFEMLAKHEVYLEGLILKTSMVLPGDQSGEEMDHVKIAEATIRVLNKSVPDSVGGVVFLSGGQTPDQATANLNEIIKLGKQAAQSGEPLPWDMTFSFSRALENEALETWRGDEAKWDEAQAKFKARLELVAAARRGELKDA